MVDRWANAEGPTGDLFGWLGSKQQVKPVYPERVDGKPRWILYGLPEKRCRW
jgi:hypothetical protein